MLPSRALGDRLVRPIGLGAMPLSSRKRPSEADALAVLDAALDAGIDLIDTADVYCINNGDLGHNERLIAACLRRRSARVLVATKGGLRRPRGAWTSAAHPDQLKAACEASLRALASERIDLYQLHAPDDTVPLADSVGALAELQAAGKIAAIGLSNVSVAEIELARSIVPIVSVQNRFNPLDPSPITDGVLDWCTRNGVGFLAYSPVGGSEEYALIGRHPALIEVGRRIGASPYQVALAWLLACSPVVIPIPGASKLSSVHSSAAVMDMELSASDKVFLDHAFLPG